MRIALVNQWYPPDYGGVGVYNEAMAHAYVALGHQVTVITARSSADLPPVSEEHGVRVYRVDRWVEPYRVRHLPVVGGHARSLRHLAYSQKVCGLLDDLASRCAFDVVEYAEINAEGWFSAVRGNRLPAVVRCHIPHALLRQQAPEDQEFETTLIERAEAAFMRRATALTAPSVYLARWIEKEVGLRAGRVLVIPNGIDVTRFSPGPPTAVAESGAPLTILYVGRLERMKGCFVLAEALARLAGQEEDATTGARRARWHAIFVGSDRPDAAGISGRARLERFFAERGLADRVELRGFMAHPDLINLYRSADVCVVPSLQYESFSYTCLEAMACGRPLVATTRGAIPEVVTDGEAGLLVPADDPAALADALVSLLGDAGLRRRLGHGGRERAVQLYGDDIVARQNLAVYEEVIRCRRDRCG